MKLANLRYIIHIKSNMHVHTPTVTHTCPVASLSQWRGGGGYSCSDKLLGLGAAAYVDSKSSLAADIT